MARDLADPRSVEVSVPRSGRLRYAVPIETPLTMHYYSSPPEGGHKHTSDVRFSPGLWCFELSIHIVKSCPLSDAFSLVLFSRDKNGEEWRFQFDLTGATLLGLVGDALLYKEVAPNEFPPMGYWTESNDRLAAAFSDGLLLENGYSFDDHETTLTIGEDRVHLQTSASHLRFDCAMTQRPNDLDFYLGISYAQDRTNKRIPPFYFCLPFLTLFEWLLEVHADIHVRIERTGGGYPPGTLMIIPIE